MNTVYQKDRSFKELNIVPRIPAALKEELGRQGPCTECDCYYFVDESEERFSIDNVKQLDALLQAHS